jgi:chromosome segregation ATPase
MVEAIMYFGGGFLVACLLALVLISSVHHRAVRLTLRRLEDAVPISLAEIQADKDKLRAQFAMSARRLEMSVEQLKAKAANQLGDLARKTEAIAKLKAELAEKTAFTDALDAKAKSLGIKNQEAGQEHTAGFAAVETAAWELATKEAELAKAEHTIRELTLGTETQRVEIALLKTQIEQFKARIDELQHEARDAARRLFDERAADSTVTKAPEGKRPAADSLHPQVARLGRDVAAASKELELRSRRIDELEAHIREQDHLLGERAAEAQALRRENATIKQQASAAAAQLRADKADAERQLQSALEIRTQAQNEVTAAHNEVAALRREAEETWRAERAENNLLRERITDIAAQVAHMAMARDKTGSPIAAILTEPASIRPEGLERVANLDDRAPRGATLTDRIRTLQKAASRVSTAS